APMKLPVAVYTLIALATLALAPLPAPAAPARAPTASSNDLSVADQAFLSARDAVRIGNRERLAQSAARLADHPLAAYIEYWQLLGRIQSGEPKVAADVAQFMRRHADTYIADRLRFDVALALASRGDYAGLEREAVLLAWWTDDAQFRCYLALSKYRRAGAQQAENFAREARQLLANTKDSAGEGCLALTEALLADGRISVWDRVRALVEQNQLDTAKRIGARALDESGRPVDQKLLMQAIDRPASFLTAHERRLTEVQRELAMVAVVRLARDNPQDAAEYAGALNLLLTPEQRGIVWGRIGHMAALRLMPEANEWYRRGGEHVGIGPDAARVDEVLEWQVRSALRANDWKTVKTVIDRMPAALREDPAWIYWYARALRQAGRPVEADDLFARIAQQFHFYGQLAAEELEQAIVLPPRAEAPTPEEIAPFESNVGFVRAFKFYELGLRLEGNREWNWQMRGLSDRQLLAAAEFARKRGVLDRMISTSDRTKNEFDFEQRFPAPFRDSMIQYSAPLGLDENWIYGLIRQESRFITDARSSVGASGLMQLMPATARYVAKRLNVPNFTPARVNELDVNLQLGTGYLKMVLDDLDGSPMLATAAYNAGPSRPRAWRSSLTRPVEGAVFAETIPFNETRDYVKKVMSNSVYYAALFDNKAPSLKARLGTIAPKAAGTTELP
ncbi:MAG TPA: transglycosylase SLT domain-containing protein, partial [Burkholderiaceae bacterium]|nr:transglycosylase SLT domain-containing protein [Burkholderiaceae bacterium]